jgi:gliding motility-associated-like protein
MRQLSLILKLTILFIINSLTVHSQCPQNNTLIGTVTPPCPGTSTTLCIDGGEYINVNVVAGNEYTFSTCGNTAFDTQITVYNGATVIGYNDDACGTQSTVTWTATFTGVVSVLIDEYNCSNTGLCTDLDVTCSLPVQIGNGCNPNTTICTSGVAGPFGFSTPGVPVSSCLDYIGLTYAYVVLYVTQTGPLQMLIDGDATTGFLDVAIFDIPTNSDPCIAIQDVNNEISCNYAISPGGCNEIGTFFGCSSSVPSPMVTAGDVLMILVENWSNASTSFTLDLGPSPAAQTGPPPATINPAGPFCSNSAPFQLTSVTSGGSWSGPGVSSTGLFNPALTGVGTFTITHNVGTAPCASSATTTIVVNAPPTINAGLDQAICAGTSVTLSGAGASTYTWNNGVTNGVAFTPAATATYTLTGTTGAGCVNTDQVLVTVNPIPIVNAGPDISICTGGSTTLTAVGATTYSWAPGGQTTAAITVTPASTTTYTVTGTSLNCTATDAVTVTMLSNAPINAGPDIAICSGSSTTLSASGGTTYSWNNGLLGIGNNLSVSPSITTTYTVVGTNAAGCTGTDALIVTVNPLPTVNAGQDQTVCAGTAVTLSGAGASTYSWNNAVTNGVAFTPTTTTTYTVTGTSTANCSSTDQVLVTVIPLPTVSAGGDQTVCAGTTVILNGSGATNYTWNNGVTNGVAFTPSATTTYTVTGTSASNCTSTDQVLVTVNPLPTVSAGPDQTLCLGQTFTLAGSGAATYTWNNGITNNVAFTPTLGTTTYTVTGTSSANCSNTDQVIISVNPLPAPVINGASTYCVGTSALLSTSVPFTSYSWSTGSTNPTINATSANNPITVTVTNAFGCQATSPVFAVNENNIITANFTITICEGQSATIHGVNQTAAGVYSQIFSLGTGCDSTSNVTLVVNPLPTVNAGIDQDVCTGTTTTLTATGASTYTWNNGVTNGISFTQAIGATTYTVIGTSAAGCTNTDQATITVNPLPTIGAGNDQTVCAGTAVTLNGSGAATYAWNNAVTNAVAFTPITTNTYTVIGTDANGCTNTDQVLVTVNPIPTVGAGADQTICIGASVTLSGSGAASYAWDNGVTNAISFAPNTTTTYTVTGSSAAGCVNTDQVTVTVDPIPTVNAGADQTICAGTSITLNGAGANTYSWNNGVTNGTAFTPLASATYTVTGTSTGGCSNTDQVTVTVDPLPSVNAGGNQSICAGTAVTLSGSGASIYTWNNGVTNGIPFTPSATTTYTVTGTSASGCINTDQVLVTVNPIPTVFAGNDISICDGQTATLTGSGAASYTWDNGAINGVAFTPITGTTYTVTGTSAAGCINTDQVNVTVNPIPNVTFAPDTTEGCAPLTVNFTNSTPNATNCVWTMSDGSIINGCGTISNTFTMPGCYDVTLTTTSNNGCVSSFTSTNLICIEDSPNAGFTTSNSILTDYNTNVIFNNTSTGAYQYLWDFGDNSATTVLVDPSHDYVSAGYGTFGVTLYAFSPLGCVDSAFATIQINEPIIFYVPNSFTPDFDDYNQTFQPIFTSGYDPFDFTMLIYNRWGELIFETHDVTIGWDGSYGSNREIDLVQEGSYNWKIEFKTTSTDERKMVLGHVNVLR